MADARGVSGGRQAVFFSGFCFEPTTGRLWRGGEELSLRPKAAGVLALMVEKAGELVTKSELMSSVWPEGFVGEAVLTGCVNELRQLFGDDPRAPRFIATVPRRGYRLVAGLSPAGPDRLFVGREAALSVLESWWGQALQGRPAVAFVDAPAGVGKTALIDRFAEGVRATGAASVVWGQCVEQFGAGEPYLPVLQALDGLCKGPGGAEVIEVLRHRAPSWCGQLGLLDDHDASIDWSGQRMLGQFGAAVEALSMLRPLLLLIEDLHAADHATTELISYLARRREPARLLVLGSYRPGDLIASRHPLRPVVQDLRAHGLCGHLSLELLSSVEIHAYLSARLAPGIPSLELVRDVQERTEGNALFVVAITDLLIEREMLLDDETGVRAPAPLSALGIPSDVRQMLERQIEALDEGDVNLLVVAAAVGMEFAAEAVRAGIGPPGQGSADRVEIEERCEALARRHALLVSTGEARWPDGTVSGRYRFSHEMYQEVLYERLTPSRRAEVHRRIGERLAAGHGQQASELAVELSMHVERGGDYSSAGGHLIVAATTALRRSAYPEATSHTERVLGLLERIPDPVERERLELSARRVLVVAAAASWDWRSPEAAANCRRLATLAQSHGDATAAAAALLGLHNHAQARGDTAAVASCLAELEDLVRRQPSSAVELVQHFLKLQIDSRAGRCASALEHAQAMLERYRPAEHATLAVLVGDQFDVAAHLGAGIALWELGRADQARRHVAEGVTLARGHEIPAVLARALWYEAVVHLVCGHPGRVRAVAAELEVVCVRHDLRLWRAGGGVLDGWAKGAQGDLADGMDQLRRGMADWAEMAPTTNGFHQRLLAELCLAAGDTEAGLSAVQVGLDMVARTGQAQSESELRRLRGELLLQRGAPGDAEAAVGSVRHAFELAAEREAPAWQLRAATSLARLGHQQADKREALALLERVYGTFTEGHDTADLRLARTILGARRVSPRRRKSAVTASRLKNSSTSGPKS